MGLLDNIRKLHISQIVVLEILVTALQQSSAQVCDSSLGVDSLGVNNFYSSSGIAKDVRTSSNGWLGMLYNGPDRDFVRVDLGKIKRITRISMSAHNIGYFVRRFRIFYSPDYLEWKPYKPMADDHLYGEMLNGNVNQLAPVNVVLDPPIDTRYIVVNPVEYSGPRPGMKLELYGCTLAEANAVHIENFTNIQGHITSDTVWTVDHSPYIIGNDTDISSSATLTIQPGVHVIFLSNVNMTVKGNLRAIGTEGQRIVFSTNWVIIAQVTIKWTGLISTPGGKIATAFTDVVQAFVGVTGSAEDLRLEDTLFRWCDGTITLTNGNSDQNTVSFRNVDIRNSNIGYRLTVSETKPYVVITGGVISDLYLTGISVLNDHCNLAVTDTWIFRNKQFGIRSTYASKVQLHNVTIEDHGRDGLQLSQTKSSKFDVRVTSSRFLRNNHGIFIETFGQTQNGAWVIEDNLFQDNAFSGLNLDLSFRRTPTDVLSVKGNTFTGNGKKTAYALNFIARYDLEGIYTLEQNYFIENKQGLLVGIQAPVNNNLQVKVHNNTFVGTLGTFAVNLDVEDLEFSNNVLRDNRFTAIFAKRLNFARLFRNLFSNPLTSYDMWLDNQFDAIKTVNASYNYWGASTPEFVRSRVRDFYHNIDYAAVTVSPFYTTPSMTTSENGESFRAYDPLSAGGKLTADVTIPRNSDYMMTRSIWVPTGFTLTIERNCTLRFGRSRGFYVEGSLKILGTNTEKVNLMNSGKNDVWYGIRLVDTGIHVENANMNRSTRFVQVRSTLKPVTINMTNVETSRGQSALQADISTTSSISINNCTFSEPDNGVTVHMQMDASVSMTVSSSNFLNCAQAGIKVTSDKVDNADKSLSQRIVHTTFRKAAIALDISTEQFVRITSLNVSSCAFEDGTSHPFKIHAWMDELIVENSHATDNIRQAELTFYNECSGQVAIFQSRFSGTLTGSGLVLATDSGNSFQCPLIISKCTFNDTDQHGLLLLSTRFSNVGIDKTKFGYINGYALKIDITGQLSSISVLNNEISNSIGALDFKIASENSKVTIIGNTFTENTGEEVIVLETGPAPRPTILFTRNNMEGHRSTENNVSVVVVKHPNINLTYNVYNNPEATFNVEYAGPTDADSPSINASHSYWGTVDRVEISRTILNSRFDNGLDSVTFIPYMADSSLTYFSSDKHPYIRDDGTIGGPVDGTVTLTIDNSPYIVSSLIELEEGDCLRIDRGVVLLFQQATGLFVKGKLIVSGTEEQPVKFLSDVDRQWYGINFQKGSELSTVEHLVVNNTENGLTAQSYVQLDHVTSDFSTASGFYFMWDRWNMATTMRGLKASNNRVSGIEIRLGRSENKHEFKIDGCELVNNAANGISVGDSGYVAFSNCVMSGSSVGLNIYNWLLGSVHVDTCEFSRNRKHAIVVARTHTLISDERHFSLENSRLHDHTYEEGNVFQVDIGQANALTTWRIIENVFTRNHLSMIAVNVLGLEMGMNVFSILNNDFFENSGEMLKVLLANYPSASLITDFVVEGNHVLDMTTSKSLVTISYEGIDQDRGSVTIKSNTFLNNAADSVICLMDPRTSPIHNTAITDNVFRNNSVSITVKNHVYGTTAPNNIYDNPMAECELDSPPFQEWALINATNSFWGVSDLEQISEKICGFNRNMTRARISFLPYRLGEEPDNLVAVPSVPFFMERVLGGEISENLILQKNATPYVILRSIFIPDGVEFRVESGCVIQFAAGRGIYVKGVATIGAESGRGNTRLTSTLVDSWWHGIVFAWNDDQDKVHLVNGSTPSEGLLKVSINGELGTVCNTGFQAVDAKVVCRSLGFNRIDEARIYTGPFSVGSDGPILMSDLNCAGHEASIFDCEYKTREETNCQHYQDVRVTCSGARQSGISGLKSHLINTDIERTTVGVVLESLSVSISNSLIANSRQNGVTLKAQYDEVNFHGSFIMDSMDNGIEIIKPTYTSIRNVTISNSGKHGIRATPNIGHVGLHDVIIRNSGNNGVYVAFNSNNNIHKHHVTVERCSFEEHHTEHAMYIQTETYKDPSRVVIRDNVFRNNTGGSVYCNLNPYSSGVNTNNTDRVCVLKNNVFHSSGPNTIKIYNNLNLEILGNRFDQGDVGSSCLLTTDTAVNSRNLNPISWGNVTIRGNTFENSDGRCMVELILSNKTKTTGRFTGAYDYNNINNCRSVQASLVLQSPSYSLADNNFENPDSTFEAAVTWQKAQGLGDGTIDAANNWWGTSDLAEVRARVFDAEDNSTLYALNLDAIKTSRVIAPSPATTTRPPTTTVTKPTTTTTISLTTTTKPPTTTTKPPTTTTTMPPATMTKPSTTRTKAPTTTTISPTTTTKPPTTTTKPPTTTATMPPTTTTKPSTTTTKAPTTTTISPTTTTKPPTTTTKPSTTTTTMPPTTTTKPSTTTTKPPTTTTISPTTTTMPPTTITTKPPPTTNPPATTTMSPTITTEAPTTTTKPTTIVRTPRPTVKVIITSGSHRGQALSSLSFFILLVSTLIMSLN